MNCNERVTAALTHKEADRVPVYPVMAGCNRRLVNADYPTWSTDADVCAASFIKAADEFDIDCVVTLIDLSVECDAWGQELIYPADEAAHPNYQNCVIKEIEDYEKIQKVDYRQSKRMQMALEVNRQCVKALKDKMPVVAFIFGPMGTLSMLRNQEDMYMDLYDDPDAVKEAIGHINETLKEYVVAMCETGVNAIMFDTLFASGSIMSKDMWREMESEYVRELADLCREHGVGVMIHNCGDKIYFDAQIEAMHPDAISFLYPPDDCKDFYECKEKYGDKTTLIGAVTPANAVIGTDEEWDDQCKHMIDAMSKDGGFMLATGCEYPANASFDRAKRMIEIAKTYGQYKK